MTFEQWSEQYNREYIAEVDLEAGTWTYTHNGITKVFRSRGAWLRFIDTMRSRALKNMLRLRRDYTSDIQAFPGTKPLYLNDDEGGLSKML